MLTKSETALLLDKLHGKDRVMVLVGLFTGMRLNEVLRLNWQDIDFSKGLITFTQSKTGKLVTVPLSSYLVDELLRYKTSCIGDRLFEDREINSSMVTNYSGRFSDLFKQFGIHSFTFHNLRHTFATLHSDVGSDIVTTKELLGHSDITMTMRYSHKQMDVKRNAIERITNHVLDMNGQKTLTIASGTT